MRPQFWATEYDRPSFFDLLERLNDPLTMLPGVVVFGVVRENDLAESELQTGISQPLDQNPAVLPVKKPK